MKVFQPVCIAHGQIIAGRAVNQRSVRVVTRADMSEEDFHIKGNRGQLEAVAPAGEIYPLLAQEHPGRIGDSAHSDIQIKLSLESLLLLSDLVKQSPAYITGSEQAYGKSLRGEEEG